MEGKRERRGIREDWEGRIERGRRSEGREYFPYPPLSELERRHSIMLCAKYNVILFFSVLLNVHKWYDMIWHDKYVKWYSEQRWNRKRKEERGKSTSCRMLCIDLSFVHIISHYIYLYLSVAYIIYHIYFLILYWGQVPCYLIKPQKCCSNFYFIQKIREILPYKTRKEDWYVRKLSIFQ